MKALTKMIAVAVLAYAHDAARAKDVRSPWRFSDLAWTDLRPDGKAAGSVLWGDPARGGGYGMLIRFRAGFDRGWHLHTHPVHAVMISGTLTVEPESGAPQDLTAGSGVNEVAGARYRLACKGGSDCVFLLTGEDRFDTIDAGPPAAAR